MWNERIQLGLPKPEKELTDIRDMRKAIDRAARDSHLIRNALDAARYSGLSGEDAYTLLAYHALLALEIHYQMNMNWLNVTPSPRTITMPAPQE